MTAHTFDDGPLRRIERAVRKSEGGGKEPPQPKGSSGAAPYWWLLKANTAVSKGSTGTFAVYKWGEKGAETDTGETVTAYNRWGDIVAEAWCLAVNLPHGKEIIMSECEASA